jgi:hypothetical protein
MNTAYAHNHDEESDDEVTYIEFVEKVGRSESEYFFSPIVGVNYSDVTNISSSFLTSDSKSISNDNSGGNNSINVNNTELGAVVGFFVDGQYQITATDYWRAGFQTGLIYEAPSESEFDVNVCDSPNDSGCNNPNLEHGSLEFSSLNLPVLFTFSRYAEEDDYIVTLKLGPILSYHWYDLDFDGFEASPETETQILFAAGLDGRYRIDEDNFLLVGFLSTNIFNNNNNNGFSGVNTFGEFSVYAGWSFS